MNQILYPRASNEMLIINDNSFESFNSHPSYKHINVTSESYSVNLFLGVFFYLMWGILFTIFTSNENYYTEECGKAPLLGWSKAIGISNIICCIISVCFIPGLIFYIDKKSKNSTVYSYYETVDNGMKMALKLIKIMRILLIVNFVVFYIAAIVVYSLEFYCKHLSTLMFFFIVMCSVFIGIIGLIVLLYVYNAYHKRIQSQELKFKYIQ